MFETHTPWGAVGIVLASALVIGVGAATKAADQHEPYYAERWCEGAGGESEVILESRDRVDCMTPARAWEVEWGAKYREGLGQALDYGEQTGEAAGLMLLVADEKDRAGVERARVIRDHYGLPLVIRVQEVQ